MEEQLKFIELIIGTESFEKLTPTGHIKCGGGVVGLIGFSTE